MEKLVPIPCRTGASFVSLHPGFLSPSVALGNFRELDTLENLFIGIELGQSVASRQEGGFLEVHVVDFALVILVVFDDVLGLRIEGIDQSLVGAFGKATK